MKTKFIATSAIVAMLAMFGTAHANTTTKPAKADTHECKPPHEHGKKGDRPNMAKNQADNKATVQNHPKTPTVNPCHPKTLKRMAKKTVAHRHPKTVKNQPYPPQRATNKKSAL